MTQTYGIGDRPLENFEQEKLGISNYGRALAQFVQRCDTPLTIGLQGDWGSGKTSLMNCMAAALRTDPSVRPVWVNTWAYAQLGDESILFLAVLEGVVDALARVAPPNLVESAGKLFRAARKLALGAARIIAGVQGAELKVEESGPDAKAAHQLAFDLKENLAKTVAAAAGDKGRVVLFVDDLDRIPPPRAVQILEALKNFLDVPGLVTVLACDYGVISRGLTARMGVGEAELGRSFFDKIIQVPFRMPTHVYKATGYVQQLLRQVGVQAEEKLVVQVTDLLAASVGLNPRALKRHANTLLLLKLVAEQTPALRDAMQRPQQPVILLALIAMEAAYPALHAHLAKILHGQDRHAVRAFLNGDAIPDPKTSDIGGLIEGEGSAVTWAPRVKAFVGHLFSIVDQDGSGNLDDNELEALQVLMVHSAVSSVASGPPRPPTADLAAEALELVARMAPNRDHRKAWMTLLGAFGSLGFEMRQKPTCVHMRRRARTDTGGARLTEFFAIYGGDPAGPLVQEWGSAIRDTAELTGLTPAWRKFNEALRAVPGRTDDIGHNGYPAFKGAFSSAEACEPFVRVLQAHQAFFDADWTTASQE